VSSGDISGQTSDTGLSLGSFTQTLYNASDQVQWVDYRIHPYAAGTGSGVDCHYGTSRDTVLRIWVNPTPRINIIPSADTLCYNEGITFTVESGNYSTIGTWVYDIEVDIPSGIINASGGTGLFPGDFDQSGLMNTDTMALTVIYRFIPRIINVSGTISECKHGIIQEVRIIVNPQPRIFVNYLPDTIICYNEGISFNPTTGNGYVQGNWVYDVLITDISDAGSIEGENGGFDLSEEIFNQDIINTSLGVQWIEYTFVPKIKDVKIDKEYCENGVARIIKVYLNPQPGIIVTTNPDTIICDNEGVDFDVQTNNTSWIGELKYDVRYVASNSSAFINVSDDTDRELLIIPSNYPQNTIQNISDSLQYIDYSFIPKIKDPRSGRDYCEDGVIQTIRIWVNPRPKLQVLISDTIYCDTSTLVFNFESLNGPVFGDKVYRVEIDYEPGAVSNTYIPGQYLMNDLDLFSDDLVNNTDSLQKIIYTIRPRFMDPKGNNPSEYCENGFDTTITIYLNPTPRMTVIPEFDIYCDSSEILLELISGNPTHTGEKYYYLESSHTGDISGISPDGYYPLSDITDFLINNVIHMQTVTYRLTPVFRDYRNRGVDEYCASGIRETVTLTINPTPIIQASIPFEDTVMCNNSSVEFSFFNAQITTGVIGYKLSTSYHSVNGVKADIDNDLSDFTDNLENTSDSIQEIHYTFTPVIYNARPGFDCVKGRDTTIVVKVVPELYTIAVTDSFIGGYNIQCFNHTTDLDLIVHGGYYLQPFTYFWTKDGVPLSEPNIEDLYDIRADTNTLSSTYAIYVHDLIGCSYNTSYTVSQPPKVLITETISPQTCGLTDAAIYLSVGGGTPGYDYRWDGPEYGVWYTEDIENLRYGQYILTLTDTNNCVTNRVYFLDPPVPITVTLTSISRYGDYNIKCYDESNGYMRVSLDGGTGDTSTYYYSWEELNTGSVDPSKAGVDRIWNQKAGFYTLEVMDELGCYGYSDWIELTQPDPVTVNRTGILQNPPFDVSCFGFEDGVINLDIAGGHTSKWPNNIHYEWTSNNDPEFFETTRDIDELPAGIYNFTVTDSLGCQQTETFTLAQPDELILDTLFISDYNGYNVSCFGYNNSKVELDVKGGYGTHNYEWATLDGVITDNYMLNQELLPAGTYTLHVSDEINCQATWDIEILQPDTLNINPVIFNNNGFNISCFGGDDGDISLNTNGGVIPYNFTWITSDGSGINTTEEDQSGLTAGKYSVNIIDFNNCTGNWDFELIQPEKLVSSYGIVPVNCFGFNNGAIDLTVSGGVESYSCLWNTGDTSEDLDSVFMGTYYVDIIDANNCHISDTMVVTEPPEIIINFDVPLYYNGRMISCHGESDADIFTSVTGGYGRYTYEWEGRTEKDTLLRNVGAGMYILQIIDENDCRMTDSVLVVEPLPVITEIYTSDPKCYGSSDGTINLIVWGGTPAYSILWDSIQQTGPLIKGLSKGEYRVKIADLNNCSIDTFTTLFEPEPMKISKDTTLPFCPDTYDGRIEIIDINGGTAPYVLTWQDGSSGYYLDALNEGVYIVNIEDNNRCMLIDTTVLNSINNSCLVIPTAFTPNGDGYNDTWEIENIEIYPDARVEIFNRWGELLFVSGNGYEKKWDGTYKGRDMPIDSYHFILHIKKGKDPVVGIVTIIR